MNAVIHILQRLSFNKSVLAKYLYVIFHIVSFHFPFCKVYNFISIIQTFLNIFL